MTPRNPTQLRVKIHLQSMKSGTTFLFLLKSGLKIGFAWLLSNISRRRMVNTRSTRRSGSGASGVVAAGLGPRGGVNDRDHATSSRTTRRSRIESSHSTPVESYDPSEYTPRTPTREDLEDTIENLKGENVELRSELSRVQSENDEVREEKFKVEQENEDLFELVHKLAWKCKVIEWDRRIIARSWKKRLEDRALYYRGAASEYVGLIKGYISSWALQYRNGPS